jgi:PKD repeat protein
MKRIEQTKRIMIYISVLCAAIILMPVVVGADDIASATSVSIGDLNCPADGTVTAPIMLWDIQDYGTGKIDITYNPAVVHVTGVASSSDSTVITHNKSNSAGITSIAAWNTDGVSGDIVFANVTFTAVGTGSTQLNLDVTKLADTSTQLIPLTISNGSIGIESLQPSTPFLVQGYVYYENGSECNNSTVNLTNLDTGGEWTAGTIESSNYYHIMLGSADIVAGEILQFNVLSLDGSQSVVTEHNVTQDEINDGGLFNYNIMLGALNMPPVADSNGPYTGTEGTEIAFDGSASSDPDGSIVSYDWDFGDGTSATEVSPVHIYTQNDTYTVTLTVTDNDGVTDTVSTTATISDTEPVADFTATPTAGPEPLTVTFTETSTSYDGITAWEWDFNNDSTVDSTVQSPAYEYTQDGTYAVTLTVYEADGDSDTETKINYITVTNVNQAPVAEPSGPYTGAEGTEVAFDGSASSDPDGSIVSYDWDFGDSTSATEVSPVHIYTQNDTYTVTLIVTDNDGVTDTVTTTATISDTEPVADFTATPTAGPEPLTVTFTETSTSYDGITAWEWDFNNDSTVDSTVQNPTHTYTGDGAYSVTLKVFETDGNNNVETKVDYITVTDVNQAPVAEPSGPYTGAEGTEVAFDGSASSDPDGSIVSYDWDFGDSTSATEVSPVHTYVQDGTYTINLTVTDNDGATDSDSTTATISDTEPVADFTATPTAGPQPLTVTFFHRYFNLV